ncbi:50S ribosomal protein L1 [Candidatus Micrarchaeota archaeon]|nr:50S ribosomal protein L1 [Candidatus Micrarchaeota archaeon]
MDKKQIKEALETCLQDKGKKKFKQTVELIINYRGIDFKKPENRLNLDIILPKGRGKEPKIIVFADGQPALEAKQAGAEVIAGDQIPELAKNKNKVKTMANHSEFLAEPKLMAVVGKHLGQVLGTRKKLPTPLVGNVKSAIDQAKRRTRVTTKGRYLPVTQCPVGSEDMEINDLVDNIETVHDKLKGKISDHNIKSVYVKLTMGKAIKLSD